MKKFLSILTLIFFFSLVVNSTAVEAVAAKTTPNNPTKTTAPATSKKKPSKTTTPATPTTDTNWIKFLNGSTDYWMRDMANSTYSGSVSTKMYSNDGIPAYRFELRKTDPNVQGGKRSEIERIKHEPAQSESTYNFSILMPKGGDEDFAVDPDGGEIIAQWHNTPDSGEEWTYPPLALQTWGDRYILWRVWDDAPLTTNAKINAEGKRIAYDLGSFLDDKGKWVDWKFHVKWGWLPSQHPIIQVYKNGNKVFELKDQPNTTNDRIGNYMKIGLYKWEWGHPEVDNSILTDRVIYFGKVNEIVN